MKCVDHSSGGSSEVKIDKVVAPGIDPKYLDRICAYLCDLVEVIEKVELPAQINLDEPADAIASEINAAAALIYKAISERPHLQFGSEMPTTVMAPAPVSPDKKPWLIVALLALITLNMVFLGYFVLKI